MEIRKLNPKEYGAADLLESLSFVDALPEAEAEAKEEQGKYQADRWGYIDESGKIRATLTNHDLPIYFNGGVAPARGVGGVASDPVSRGQGHIRALMEHVLKDDRKNGQLFSALYPFSHPFYRKFGYETCFETYVTRFPSDALKKFRSDYPPEVRMIRPEDGPDALYPIYTAFAKQYNLAIARDERIWKRHKLIDPKKAEKYCYVLSRDGIDTAYAVFNFRSESQPYVRTLRLTDYAFLDVQAFHDLLGFLYRYTAQAKHIELIPPQNLPLSSLLPEAYEMETAMGVRPMARALNVRKVLRAMRYPKENGEFSIYVDDDIFPENTMCYRVNYTQKGGVTVIKDDEAELCVSIGTFTQLALGFLDIGEAAYKPDVKIFDNMAELERVFVKKPVFLWDFY